MASQTFTCRLCVNICNGYKYLYDQNGYRNAEMYDIFVKFFHPMFLTLTQMGQPTVICLNCCRVTSYFNEYQKTVLLSQGRLMEYNENQMLSRATEANTSMPEVCNRMTNFTGNTPNVTEPQLVETRRTITPTHDHPLLREALCSPVTDNIQGASFNSASYVPNNMEPTLVNTTGSSFLCNITADASVGPSNCTDYVSTVVTPTLDSSQIVVIDSDDECTLREPSLFDISNLTSNFPLENSTRNDVSYAVNNFTPPYSHDFNEDDQLSDECEEPVGVFTGGEFSNVDQPQSTPPYICKENTTTANIIIDSETSNQSDEVIAQWSDKLECPICHEYVPKWNSLQQHFRKQHPKERPFALCCNRKLFARGELSEHALLHIEPDTFTCECCEKVFSDKYVLRSHLRKMNENLKNGIDKEIINKQKRRRTNRDYDNIIARWKTILRCAICNESHESFSSLNQHFCQKHSNEKAYIICCHQKLESRMQIADHATLHVAMSHKS